MNSIRSYHHNAANGLPANARGICADAKRLRGKFLADFSYIRKRHHQKSPTPDTSHLKPAPAFIDDGD